jgi:hypothetical protein
LGSTRLLRPRRHCSRATDEDEGEFEKHNYIMLNFIVCRYYKVASLIRLNLHTLIKEIFVRKFFMLKGKLKYYKQLMYNDMQNLLRIWAVAA